MRERYAKGTRMRKKFGLAVLSLLVLAVLATQPIAAAGVPDEQYVPPPRPNSTDVGIQFLDSLFINMAGYLVADSSQETSGGTGLSTVSQDFCQSINDAVCTAGASIYYSAHLPKCADAADVDCVVGIYALKADGSRVDGVFQHGLPDSPPNPYAGDSSLGIPRSGVDGVWNLPGIINGGGTDSFLVIAEQFGLTSKPIGSQITQRIDPNSFSAGIVPVKEISGAYKPANVVLAPTANGAKRLAWQGPEGPNVDSCADVSTTICAQREAFPSDVTFGMSVRLSGEIKGWLHGRINNPVIQYKYSPSGTLINVEAAPVTVPIVAGWTDRSNLPAVIPGSGGLLTPGTAMLGSAAADFSIDLLKVWLPLLGDKAQASPTSWAFGNLPYSNLPGANSCMFDSKSLAGFVSTNSTTYSPGPPVFNPSTESLDYKLASPHFTSTGDVFKGSYNLVIRSDVARCIYKFTNAPIKATISVTDDSGQSSVAVESMTERDGWIYLSASNFTFSSPTIHVKLTGTPIVSQSSPAASPLPSPMKTQPPVSRPSPPPTSALQPAKKSTIVCLKGSATKKVIAIKPACPSGWKKKG